MRTRVAVVILAVLSTGLFAVAQETAPNTSAPSASTVVTSTSSPVPRFVRFSGVAKDTDSKPLNGTIGITFLLYKDQQGGSPLWMETQNVQADAAGHYSVQLGATQPNGLPTDVFTSGEARWLGVQISGQTELPRVLLLSVPYALKAGDAETIGGLPPSAFVRTADASSAVVSAKPPSGKEVPSANSTPNASTHKVLTPVNTDTSPNTTNQIAKWDGAADLTTSIITDTGNNIGIGTAVPASTLDVNGTVNATSYNLGGTPFAFGSSKNANAFLGFAGDAKTTGTANTATGSLALTSNTTGSANTANGYKALQQNVSGKNNTAIGAGALEFSISNENTAVGVSALTSNTGGAGNVAVGNGTLFLTKTGSNNTAVGFGAFGNGVSGVTTGNRNTAIGSNAGFASDLTAITGNDNTLLGDSAGLGTGNITNATAIGSDALVAASNSMVLGSINGVNGAKANTNVGIGTTAPRSVLDVDANVPSGLGPTLTLTNSESGGFSSSVSLDFNTYAPSTSGTYNPAAQMLVQDDGNWSDDVIFQANGVGSANKGLHSNMVILGIGHVGIGAGINVNGVPNLLTLVQGEGSAIADGWTTWSSRRWKTNIQPLAAALNKVEHLRGVSYDLKASGKHEIGVIAEEVGTVVPEVVSYEENGKDARGVDYSRLTALLIEAIKEQQREISSLRMQVSVLRTNLTRIQSGKEPLRKTKIQPPTEKKFSVVKSGF